MQPHARIKHIQTKYRKKKPSLYKRIVAMIRKRFIP